MLRLALAIGFCCAVLSCSPIQRHQILEQPIGQVLHVGVGEVVAHVNKQRNLQNAFGASDIFGRRTNEGFAALRYMGLHNSEVAVFQRQEVRIDSNETTMSRSGGMLVPTQSTTSYSGTVNGSPYSGTVTTSGAPAYIPPPQSQALVSALRPNEFAVNLAQEKVLLFEGRRIEVLSATPTQISYIIR